MPFHAWTPQAYAGGTEPVAAFLAATSKVAALAALVVVLRPLADAGAPVLVGIGVLAALSMTVGNVLALVQDDPVRLLAWSTVAQAGWVILPLTTLVPAGLAASGGYLLAYVIATLVAFTVVVLVSGGAGARDCGPHASRHTGACCAPGRLLGALLGLALVSLAGLPPGVLGLVAKVVALRPVVAEGLWVLALVAVRQRRHRRRRLPAVVRRAVPGAGHGPRSGPARGARARWRRWPSPAPRSCSPASPPSCCSAWSPEHGGSTRQARTAAERDAARLR